MWGSGAVHVAENHETGGSTDPKAPRTPERWTTTARSPEPKQFELVDTGRRDQTKSLR